MSYDMRCMCANSYNKRNMSDRIFLQKSRRKLAQSRALMEVSLGVFFFYGFEPEVLANDYSSVAQ